MARADGEAIISEGTLGIVTTDFLTFAIFQEKNKKTKTIQVWNKDCSVSLGDIKWYGPWRKYVFYPEADTLFDTKCLKDIVGFTDNLMLERKK